MTFQEYLSTIKVEVCNQRADIAIIEESEQLVGLKFGDEMTEYLLRYGYLAYEYVEFYGITAKKGVESSLVKKAIYLHNYYPETKGFVPLEDRGEGDYALVNSEDRVYSYDCSLKEMVDTGLSLFDYIKQRFESVQN